MLCIAAIPAISGCAHCRENNRAHAVSWEGMRYGQVARTGTATVSSNYRHDYAIREPRTTSELASTGDMPPHAKSGECYARVYVPPEFDMVTERVCIRQEWDKIETIPAVYEWVEGRVLVKEAFTQLVEVPAQFDVQDHLVQTSPGHATWVKADKARCVLDTPGSTPRDIFCLVNEPATTTTIQTERLVKEATVKELIFPAEYQTIHKQRLVRPPSTRKVTIPAEFREIKKTVMVSPGGVKWQRVVCDSEAITTNNEVRRVGDRNP